MATLDLLKKNKAPSEEEIKEHLAGNLCRCTGYTKITDSIIEAIQTLGGIK